jgi:hypothetical protein
MTLAQIREKAEFNDEIDEERLSTLPPGKQPLNFFGVSLEFMMESQKKQYPDLDVPLIFIFSLKLLHKMRGTEIEGIFRISCDVAELLALREGMQYGNFPFLPSNAHVAAALLKKWLRELENPLIPAELYEQCILLGKMELPEVEGIIDLLDNLNPINFIIMRELIALWKDISSESKVGKTKMSPEGLAIVFSPTILRCPDQDPAKVLQNTVFETKFVEHLINVLPSDYSDYSLLEVELPELYKLPSSSPNSPSSPPTGEKNQPPSLTGSSSSHRGSHLALPDFKSKK